MQSDGFFFFFFLMYLHLKHLWAWVRLFLFGEEIEHANISLWLGYIQGEKGWN